MRIVSLLPSATEILFGLGAGEDLVGVTFECDYPPEARTRRVVSTSAMREGLSPAEIDAEVRARVAAGEELYRLDEGALRELAPDLVITQDLCAVCAVDLSTVESAMSYLGCTGRVLTIDPSTLPDVLASITTIGAAIGRTEQAARLVDELQERLTAVATAVAGLTAPRVAVLEWTDPPFSTGHWVPDMIAAAGGLSVLGAPGERSRRLEWSEVATAQPELIVAAPCGFRLAEASRLANELLAAGHLPPNVPVWAVDADAAFVRPGPRLIDGVEALAGICHPDARPVRRELSAPVGGPVPGDQATSARKR